MKKDSKKSIAGIDFFFIALIVLAYVFSYFLHFSSGVPFSADETVRFIVLLNLLFLLVVVSYLTSRVVSLVCGLLYVFAYGSYILYQVVIARQSIPAESYFWLVIIPLACAMVSFYRSYLLDIQERLAALDQKSKQLVGFDGTTGQLNEHMFFYEISSFISMAKRGYIKLTVLAVRLRYRGEIERILGENGMVQLYREIGECINRVTRAEDIPFFTDDGKFILVSITDKQGGAIVKERVRGEISKLYMKQLLKTYNLTIDLQIGIAEYDETVQSPMDLLQRAYKDMEYDL